jgi:hypothetical protein
LFDSVFVVATFKSGGENSIIGRAIFFNIIVKEKPHNLGDRWLWMKNHTIWEIDGCG